MIFTEKQANLNALCLDTGASEHMFCNKKLFEYLTEIKTDK